jgi:hypothetical protein
MTQSTPQPPAKPDEIDYTTDLAVDLAIRRNELVRPLPEPKP